VSVAERVLKALADVLPEHNLEACAGGGTVSVVVKLDAAGCPKRIAVRTEVEREIARRRPVAMVG
jgi:metal-sulfur cluster biosynthetic enzyme